MKQTNNAAELMAALGALQSHVAGEIATCSHSEYVLLGVRGAAKHWKVRGWIGSCGPVSNVPIWEMILEGPNREVEWIKVPLHVTIEGDNEADRFAAALQRSMSHIRCGSSQKSLTDNMQTVGRGGGKEKYLED